MRKTKLNASNGQSIGPIFLLGIIFAFVAIYFYATGYFRYQDQRSQVEWPTTTAQVSQVEDLLPPTQQPPPSGAPTYSNVAYQYQVDGTTYKGLIENTLQSYAVGDTFQVRYNPENHAISTTELTVDISFIIYASIFSVLALVCILGSTRRREKIEGPRLEPR